MKFNLKLSQKGLILVSVPLIFELAFVSVLVALLRQTEYQVYQEARSKAIISQSTQFVKLFYDAGVAIGGYSVMRKAPFAAGNVFAFKERYNQIIDDIPNQLSVLKTIVGDEPKYKGMLEELQKNTDEALDVMGTVTGSVADTSIEKGLQALVYYKKLKELEGKLQHVLLNLTKDARQIQISSPDALARSRHLFNLSLSAGIVINIAITIALAWFFMKSIKGRLQVLNDNSMRLARNEELNKPLGGSDEIAELDFVFHQMAGALREASRKERAFLDNMLVGLVTLNKDGFIKATNPPIVRLFQYTQEDLLDQHIAKLFSPSANQDANEIFANLYDKALGHIIELEARKKGGEAFPVQVSLTEFTSGEGQQFLANILDVSELRALEKMKKEFVSTVSHELRTPLTSIRGSLSLLAVGAVGPLSEQAAKMVKIAERNTIRLIKLINDILDLEKLEAGKLEMKFADIPLSSVFERSLESVRAFAEEQGVAVDFQPTQAMVLADEDRLVQVVVNLVSNAVKFSPRAGSVTVKATVDDSAVQVQVTDRGRGIPPEFKELIFQRFQQVEVSDNTKKGGSGLGLTVCKGIIEQHQGQIGVESEPGKGSTFWFRIPKALSEGTAATAACYSQLK